MSKEKEQTIKLSRKAALEAVARAIIDFEDWSFGPVSDLSRRIVRELGFK